mgnify:CR=1 FL=1
MAFCDDSQADRLSLRWGLQVRCDEIGFKPPSTDNHMGLSLKLLSESERLIIVGL